MDHDEAIYREVEQMVEKILTSNARRFAQQLGMTLDDAVQEARLGLVLALSHYDYNASRGGMYNFAKKAVRRHFLKLWATHKAQARRPHVHLTDEDGKPLLDKKGKPVVKALGFAEYLPVIHYGERLSRKTFEGDFMDMIPANMIPPDFVPQAPDAGLVVDDAERTAGDFLKALEAALAAGDKKHSGRDLEVLRCKYDPPRGLRMLMLDELATEPTIPLIGRYLGLSKNEVDWAIRRIRATALQVIANQFSELRDLSIVQAYVGG